MIDILLFWEFFKIGLFSIGGAMATIPFLFDLSARTSWFSAQELADMIAISESTPGPIGINMATYVGFKTVGVQGAFFATLGLVTPSVIIIIFIASLLDRFAEKPLVKHTFSNLRAVVIGLISFAVLQLLKIVLIKGNSINYIYFIFFIVCLTVNLKWKKIHPLFFILIGAVFGIIFK